MNKRVPRLLLWTFFLSLWAGPLLAQSDSLIVQPGSGDPGSSGNLVLIDLKNSVGVGKMQFTLNYNANILTVTDVISTSRSAAMSIFNWSEPVPGQITVFIWDLEGDSISPGSGSIGNVSFAVSSEAHYGDVPLTISGVVVYDLDGGIVPTAIVSGTFTVTEPDIDLTATSHNYGQVIVGETSVWDVTITNLGTKNLTINYIPPPSGEFTVEALAWPQILSPGAHLDVSLSFIPTSVGPKSTDIYIVSDDPDEPVSTITLSGAGIAPEISLSDTNHDFGNVIGYSTATWVFTISNIASTANLTVTSITSNHANFIIQSPSFPRIIPIGGSLNVTVAFTPSRLGPISGMLTISSNDPDEGTLSISLTGAGYYPPARLIVEGGEGQEDSQGNSVPLSLENEMSVALVQFTLSYPHTLLSVTGVRPTSRVSPTSYFNWDEIGPGIIEVLIAAGSTGSIIGPGTGPIIESLFDVDPGAVPGNAPLVLSEVVFMDKSSNHIPALKLDGNFVILPAPDIDISEDALQFGDVLVGDSLGLTVQVYNRGTTQLTVDSITVGASQFGYQFSTFPQVIDAGDSLTGVFYFKPMSLGVTTGTAVVYSDDPNEGQKSVGLQGKGVLPDVEISPLSLGFGQVWVSDTSSVILPITNIGTADLTIHSIVAVPIQFEIISTPLPAIVPPGHSFDVTIDFHPTAIGLVEGSLSVYTDDPDEGTVVVQLSGIGIDPEIDFSATNHWYGNVLLGEHTDWIVRVRNLGLTDLIVDSVRSDHGDFQLLGLSIPQTIPAGDSALATVRFSPSGLGSRTGNVRIYTNDRDESPTVLQVTGVGVVPDIHLSSTTHNFGDVVVNRFSDWILNIYNHDVGNLIISTVTTNNNDFFITNPDFPDTVVFGDSLALTVRFMPSKTGPISGILKVMSNDPDESQVSVSVGGNGVVPDMALSATNHYFAYGVLCDTVSWVLNIYNVGTADLHIDSVYADTSDYAALEPVFPQSVSPGETLDVVVGFVPSRIGSIIGNLFLLTDDPDEDSVKVSLSGICVAPDIELAHGSYDFGQVPLGYSEQWGVTLSNVGNWNLTIDSAYTSSSLFSIQSPTFPQTILPGNGLSVVVSFAPGAVGETAANLTLLTDDCDEKVVNMMLRGAGYAVAVVVPDTSAMPTQTIAIPIVVQDVTGLDIYSWETSLSFDSDLLTAIRASSNGTISQGWGSPTFSIRPGSIDIEMSGVSPLAGAGPLVFVTFQVDSALATGDSSMLRLEEFRFNDGAPVAGASDGLFHVNRPPSFDPLSPKTAHEGLHLGFLVTASDPDRDSLTFWAANLPTGALFTSASRTFSWTPNFGSAGVYPGIRFYVSDGQFTDSTSVSITVESSIRVAVTDTTRPAGVTFSLPIVLLDPVKTEDSIYSVDLTLTYDPDVLTAIDATKEGTLTREWGPLAHRVSDGQITFGIIGFRPLNGSGILIYINFTVSIRVQPGDSSVLTLTEFQFNDGDPAVFPIPGVLTIPHYSIGGTVRYYMEHSPGLPVDSVLMEVLGSVSMTDISDEAGTYRFPELVGGLGYAIRPSKDRDYRGAIGSYDASLITRYVVGKDPLNEHQQMSADVTGNGRVSAFDASEILKFSVGLIEGFGVNEDWTFLPEQRDYPVLDADYTGQDFTGILYGDVSGNWGVTGGAKPCADNRDWIEEPEILGSPGEIVSIPIVLLESRDVLAVDLHFSFVPEFMRVLEVTTTALTCDYLLEYNATEGNLMVALAGARPLERSGEITEVICQLSPKARVGESSPLVLEVRLNETWWPPVSGTVKATEALPTEYALEQNYPNPFNPRTDIRYQIADGESSIRTRLTIFNMLGQEVKVLVDEAQKPGTYEVTWDGRDAFGNEVASGVYFYRLNVGSFSSTKRMMLMK